MPPPPPVATDKPLKQVIATPLELTGRFVATEQVDLRPQVSGQIIEVLVSDGSRVTAGATLMRLEDASLRASLAQAKANQERAEAEVLLAQQRLDRSKPLVEQKILSQQAVDDAEAALAVAIANQTAAAAAIEAATVDLAYAEITAPISGRIGRIVVTQGNVVQAGSTHLLTIISDEAIDIGFDIAEKDWLAHAERLQAALVAPDALKIEVFAGERTLPAQLQMIDNQADARGGTIRLYARLDNDDGSLLPGVFARLALHLQEPSEQLLIHEATVLSQLNSRFVYAVNSEGVTEMRPVQLGDRRGNLRVVVAGLDGNEQIALTNLKKIFFPGMPVSALPGDMTTATPVPPADAPANASAPTGNEDNGPPAAGAGAGAAEISADPVE
jgi:multidrug efflux system membrane fusion protein